MEPGDTVTYSLVLRRYENFRRAWVRDEVNQWYLTSQRVHEGPSHEPFTTKGPDMLRLEEVN